MIEITAIELLLMNYAAGNLSPAEALVVAAHLSMNPASRRKVSRYEAIGGQMMEHAPEAPVRPESLSSVLDRIKSCTPVREVSSAPKPASRPPLPVPECVHELIHDHCAEVGKEWAQRDGIEAMELRVRAPRPCHRQLQIIRLMPGQPTPRQARTCTRIMLVLAGACHDERGRYTQGDLLLLTRPSSPVAEAEGCIWLSVTEAPLRVETLLARFLDRFRRI